MYSLCFACPGHLIGCSYSSMADQLTHHNWENINAGNCELGKHRPQHSLWPHVVHCHIEMCSVGESLRQQNQGSQFAFSQLQLLVCVWHFLLLTCVHFLKLFTVLNFCHANYSALQLIRMLTCTDLHKYSQQIGWIYTVGPFSFFSLWICVCARLWMWYRVHVEVNLWNSILPYRLWTHTLEV